LVYLDNNASTPCDPRVIEAMIPFFAQQCGNASALHAAGRVAADAVEAARAHVASLIGAAPREIIFTSGATESNNLSVLGLAGGRSSGRLRIVTTAVEHKSVLGPSERLAAQGFDLVRLPVDSTGLVIANAARDAIDSSVLLVSVQLANNETGTIQAVSDIAALARQAGAVVHCDAAQAVGKIAVDVDALGVDLLSLSAHKMYGPKGVGALYVRGGPRAVGLRATTLGGGQESGLRPGTVNVPGVVGFGRACQLCQESIGHESQRIAGLRDYLESELRARVDGITINGHCAERLPNTSNLTVCGVDAEALIANLRDVAISSGSACASGAPAPSHVLTAMGISSKDAYQTIRVGIGRFTTPEDIDQAVDAISETCARLRALALSGL